VQQPTDFCQWGCFNCMSFEGYEVRGGSLGRERCKHDPWGGSGKSLLLESVKSYFLLFFSSLLFHFFIRIVGWVPGDMINCLIGGNVIGNTG
jgi:hypothetical protein